MNDTTKLELEALKVEALYYHAKVFGDNVADEDALTFLASVVGRIRSLAAEKPGDATPDAEASRKLGAEHANRLWKLATGCDVPAEAAEKIGRLEDAAEKIGRLAAKLSKADEDRERSIQNANGLWKDATGCCTPAGARNLIMQLEAQVAEAAEKIGQLEASAVDIELLRWCYRAMQLCSSSIQLDSAANALAEAYPEVKK